MSFSERPLRPARGRVPPALQPLIRAYLLGYASTVGPRLLMVLVRGMRRIPAESKKGEKAKTSASLAQNAKKVLLDGLYWRRFPAFCAGLIGGSTLLEIPLRRILQHASSLSLAARTRLARALGAFAAAYFSLQLLQRPVSNRQRSSKSTDEAEPEAVSNGDDAKDDTKDDVLAGRTLDLTLFAATRAVDVLVGALWSRWREQRQGKRQQFVERSFAHLLERYTDATLFAVSSAAVMWAWMYKPWQLPQSYDRWITTAAAVDGRLIEALRICQRGELVYGAVPDGGGPRAKLLQGMCSDYGWPQTWGDPSTTIPFPCTMVHMDCGPSCEYHALMRLWRSWKWSMATYVPLNLVNLLFVLRRNKTATRKATLENLVAALVSASRSSAFLASFIALFYYGVCLTRTRLGPRLLGTSVAARQHIDSGLCTAGGCALCGWSILLERSGRHKDIALFVAPRALGTLIPRQYAADKQWRETLVFAASAAVLLTTVQENPRRVRGFLGKLLKIVVA